MKKCFLVFILIFVSLKIFATPLIDAAKNQDYKTFERLLNDGVSLDEINESGMNVQLSLAYFNDKDFEKACELLSSKGFNFDVPVENNISLLYVLAYSLSSNKISTLLKYNVDVNRKNSITNLKPIDATQFSTFKFYSEIDGQQIVTLRQDKMKELFDSLNFDVEINNYYETDKILEQLIKTEQSEDLYVLIAMTGKNPIAPFQWVNISDCFATVISSRFKITESEYTNGFKYMMVEFKKTKISNENFPI